MGLIRTAALAAALSLALPAQEPPTPTFRADVKLVRMLVTVRNARGELAAGLEKTDFKITDNNVPQEIALFERQSAQPLSVSLLVDTSGSTMKEASYEKEATGRFLKSLLNQGNPEDNASLIGFNDEVTMQAGFTRKLSRLESALRSLKGRGATALYDALFLAADELEHRPGRHVVIVVSDGADTYSKVNFQQALEKLHQADAVVYSLAVVPVKGDAGRNLRGENALVTLSTWTGGKVFFPTADQALDQAFSDILKELRTQYLITYYPRGVETPKNGFHSVKVQVAKPGHAVSARNGYYAR